MVNKNIIFDWFTIFKFDEKIPLGKPRVFAGKFIKKLVLSGWRIYVMRPKISYPDASMLRVRLKRLGVNAFEILYDVNSLKRVPLQRAVYVDVAFFYLIGGYWVLLWLRCLRTLNKVRR